MALAAYLWNGGRSPHSRRGNQMPTRHRRGETVFLVMFSRSEFSKDGSLADETCTLCPELSQMIFGSWFQVLSCRSRVGPTHRAGPWGDHLSLRWRLLLCTHLLPALPPLPLCSKSSGSAALLALSWTCLLVRIVFPSRAKRQGDTWNKLVGSSGLQSRGG